MALLSRLKRLWQVSGEEPMPPKWRKFLERQTQSEKETEETWIIPDVMARPRGQATVMQDAPFNEFEDGGETNTEGTDR